MPRKRPTPPKPVKGKARYGLSRTVPAQIAAAAADQAAGGARTFSLVAYTGEPMNIYPYEHPVVVELASIDLSVQRLPALYDHCPDVDFVVGQIERVSIEAGNLIVAGRFTVTEDAGGPYERNLAKKVLAKADAGYEWQVSIGGNPARTDEIKAGETVNVNGRDYVGPCFVARGVVLREVSFVVLGGDRKTSAVVAKHKGTAMSFEQWCVGFMSIEDFQALDEKGKAALKLAYDAQGGTDEEVDEEEEKKPADGTPPANANAKPPALRATSGRQSMADRRRQEADEVTRVNEIRRVCAAANNPTMTTGTGTAQATVDIAAHAISEGWPVHEARREIELQQLRASRIQGPGVVLSSHDRDCTIQGLQGAMILRAGGRLDHLAYQSPRAIAMGLPAWLRAGINAEQRQRAMEAAHRYSHLSAVDILREAVRLDNREVPIERPALMRAAFSGSSLTNIFTTNVNAILIATYMEAPDSTAPWTQESDVSDFKTQEEIQLEKAGGLTKLPRGSEADHTSRADKIESYKIARYASQFVIDEQDMIDDNLSAFSDIPVEMGNAAGRLRPDLVYAVLMSNPTLNATGRELFNSTDDNLDTTSALAIATLKLAVSSMALKQQNGVNLNIKATHLLVPPTLIYTARELLQSTTIQIAWGADDETLKERGTLNTLQADQLQIVSDSRLENGVTSPDTGTAHSGSASTWYLASTLVRTIRVAYLAGTGRAPQVRSFVLDKGKYGMGWDIKMDIGAKAMDWRGLHKATA